MSTKHRGLADQFFAQGIDLAEQFIKQLTSEGKTERQRTLLFIFSRAYKSYQAIELLCKAGFVEDANDLARSIYELRLQALYLGIPKAAEADARARKFFDHEMATALGTMHILRELFPDRSAELQQGENEVRLYAESSERMDIFKKFSSNAAAARKAIGQRWWSGSIKDLLNELSKATKSDYLKEYDVIYSMLCDYSHSGVRLFRRLSKKDSFRPRPTDYTRVAWSVLDWLSQIIGITSDAFGSDFGKTVRESQQRAKKLMEMSNVEK